MPNGGLYDNKIETALSLKKLQKKKKAAYKKLSISQPTDKLERRIAQIAVANVCELTSYDALLTIVWGSPQFDCRRDSFDFPLYVLAIDLLRVAEHLEARVSGRTDASRVYEATVSQIEVFRNAGIDALQHLLDKATVEREWEATETKIAKHRAFAAAMDERQRAWTRDEWDMHVSTYPDAAMISLAARLLWAMIAADNPTIDEKQIDEIARLYSEVFLAETELESWKSKLLAEEAGAISSMVQGEFFGETEFEAIFDFVYKSDLTDELIRLIEHDVQTLIDLLRKRLLIDEAMIDFFILPAMEIVDRARKFQQYVRNPE